MGLLESGQVSELKASKLAGLDAAPDDLAEVVL